MKDAKEVNESACYLDMPNGIEKGIKYPQKFVRAPKSDYPMKASSQGRECPYDEAMRMTHGRR